MISPDRHSFIAICCPAMRVRRCVPPAPGMMPRLTSGWPNLAPAPAIVMSQCIDSSQPPPSAKPLTAAISGLGNLRMRS